MQRLTFLNTREIKKLQEIIIEQFSYFPKDNYAFLRNETGRIFLISKDLAKLDIEKLKVDKIGLYFADISSQVRLSKEGAQLLAHQAKQKKIKLKNVISLTANEVKRYFQGLDLDKTIPGENRLVLLSYSDQVFCCGQYKDGKILNYLPKIHRGEVIV